ncbi:MAG: hypothetical protein SF187_25145 [Deltaproteobacteria bacterium]|nr:hypothetical protein [Deltaproteobacteria bacterium]
MVKRYLGLAVYLCGLTSAAHAQTIVRTLGASDDRYMPGVAESATGWQASIPPLVESGPVRATGGGFCFSGGHPTTLADHDESEPQMWHESTGHHKHSYAPVDLRLFTFDGACYQFTGDPSDFGAYSGLFSFHGMHPIPQEKGGGWCYQDNDHSHAFRMRSPYMQRIAERYYWGGGFDAQFRVYYPYYVHFFRDLYPLYYSEGRYLQNRARAPSIKTVPMPAEMLSWGPPPERDDAPAPVAAPAAPAPPPPSSLQSDNPVSFATPPIPLGYGYPYARPAYGYQTFGAPLGGYGQHRPPATAPPAPAPPATPPPAPRRPPPSGPAYSVQPRVR